MSTTNQPTQTPTLAPSPSPTTNNQLCPPGYYLTAGLTTNKCVQDGCFVRTASQITTLCNATSSSCCTDGACAEWGGDGIKVVCPGACQGTEACVGLSSTVGSIGEDSCVGTYAYKNLGSNVQSIGDETARALQDFRHGLEVGCLDYNGISIGDDSCEGRPACSGSTVAIGNGSCNQWHACAQSSGGTIGDTSCNGEHACRYCANLDVGDHSCNGGASCWGRQDFAAGDNSCNELMECQL